MITSTSRKILGISAFYHDSAAALVVDGKLKENKKYWMIPLLLILLGFGVLLLLGGTAAAPFIYTLF